MTDIYGAVALLVVAQLLGVYALITRKADLIFALTMVVVLVLAAALGYFGLHGRLH